MLEDKNQNKTQLESLGEFGLIEHLTKDLKINPKSKEKIEKFLDNICQFRNFNNELALQSLTRLIEEKPVWGDFTKKLDECDLLDLF